MDRRPLTLRSSTPLVSPSTPMIQRLLLMLVLLVLYAPLPPAAAQAGVLQPPSKSTQPQAPLSPGAYFRPSVAIVIGIFSIMFSLTFVLLMYAKLCRRPAPETDIPDLGEACPDRPGLDKAAVESLPFFRFSALRGSRSGLECAVCLAVYEPPDLLRLLPRCRHAFHMSCVDRWLQARPSCPLCRREVRPEEDAQLFFRSASASSRFLFREPSARLAEDGLDLYVEREPDGGSSGAAVGRSRPNGSSSARFGVGGSFRKQLDVLIKGMKAQKQDAPPQQSGGKLTGLPTHAGGLDGRDMHRFNHRIVVFNNRWSDLNSKDLLTLDSEMLAATSSRRFDVEDAGSVSGRLNLPLPPRLVQKMEPDVEKATGRAVTADGRRSVSEIVSLSRHIPDRSSRAAVEYPSTAASGCGEDGETKDERVRRLWLPIARKTARWFARDGEGRRVPPVKVQPPAVVDV